jgi:hypothetical protein
MSSGESVCLQITDHHSAQFQTENSTTMVNETCLGHFFQQRFQFLLFSSNWRSILLGQSVAREHSGKSSATATSERRLTRRETSDEIGQKIFF